LVQTKRGLARPDKSPIKPHERVLSNVRYPQANSSNSIPDFANDLFPASPGPLDITPTDFPAITNPIPGIGSPEVPIIIGGGPGGGGGTGGSPTPPPSVPETSSWSMLILGMFLIGRGLRSSRRRLAKVETGCNLPEHDEAVSIRIAG
jgi:hypothetical protein